MGNNLNWGAGNNISYRSRSIDGCCRDCTDRYPACHDYCEKYINASNEWQESKKAYREARAKARLYEDYHIKAVVKQKKQNKWHGKKERT